VDDAVLAQHPQITPLLRINGIHPDRLTEVLRCDDQPESLVFVRRWDELTTEHRSLAGVEAIALSCGMTPRRLWELFQGASLVQARASVSVLIAESLPKIMQTAIKGAKTGKGHLDREHVLKAARILPVPKGSTTVINMPGHNADEDDEGAMTSGGDLESMDDFAMKAARAMGTKALPAPVSVLNAEIEEE
jgi:hypothetical protein